MRSLERIVALLSRSSICLSVTGVHCDRI